MDSFLDAFHAADTLHNGVGPEILFVTQRAPMEDLLVMLLPVTASSLFFGLICLLQHPTAEAKSQPVVTFQHL